MSRIIISKGEKSFELSEREDGTMWLETEDGEGMQVGSNEIFDLLEEFFRENF